jgi:hypothetical protein
MTAHDPEREPRLLAELYFRMANEELEKIAADAASLTDVARNLLKEELNGRRLDFELAESGHGRDVVEFREVVTVRKFS